jgi:MYXO-CTERM domain-containing protein
MSRSLLVCGIAAASVAASVGVARADSIFIENASFEADVLADGSWIAGAPAGWTKTGVGGVYNPGPYQFPAGVPDGFNAAYSNGGMIAQVLAAVLEPDTMYSLEVYLGHSASSPFPGYLVQLLAGGQILAEDASTCVPVAASFESTLVNFHTDSTSSLVGLPLEIRLQGMGPQVLFDDVRLNTSPVPAPGALALLAVAGLTRRRRRR